MPLEVDEAVEQVQLLGFSIHLHESHLKLVFGCLLGDASDFGNFSVYVGFKQSLANHVSEHQLENLYLLLLAKITDLDGALSLAESSLAVCRRGNLELVDLFFDFLGEGVVAADVLAQDDGGWLVLLVCVSLVFRVVSFFLLATFWLLGEDVGTSRSLSKHSSP